ncbi:MAG: TraR/DksA C4-type zinc finger protein [bacterium]|nr:TraR/DksA C4-type zinc finger protein [bacterium]
MDQKILDELKQALKKKQARLRGVIGGIAKKEGLSYTPKFVEMGEDTEAGEDEAEQYAINMATEEDLEPVLAQIEHSLEKFDNGTYGVCEKCGKEIPVERLQAAPEAEYCVEHAEE